MATLYHAPESRSTSILAAIREFDLPVDVQIVSIRRQDGSGAADPKNPHPEKKAPALEVAGEIVTERAAILLQLTDMFPRAGLGPAVGAPGRAAFVTWLVWYQSVVEPLFVLHWAQAAHPALSATFGEIADVTARLRAALNEGPWLLGETYSVADALTASPFIFFPDLTPDDCHIRDWLARVAARPGHDQARREDAAAMQGD